MLKKKSDSSSANDPPLRYLCSFILLPSYFYSRDRSRSSWIKALASVETPMSKPTVPEEARN
eukprot:scaffold6438_cov181-Amphora_coffeaeformis.AAC.2